MDTNYLRSTPGLYPDLIEPLQYRESVIIPNNNILYALWIEIKLPNGYKAGKYDLVFTLMSEKGEALAFDTVTVKVLHKSLPPQKTIRTEWFYADCLADYYNVKAFSDRHWKIIENFIKCAAENGINLILTPVFTPALDTYVGGERTTVQLVDIEVISDGKYKFGFDKLSKWVDICLKHGIDKFEIPHFFTQWGAKHAPKIIAKINGRNKRIFGWETDSHGEDYKNFLAQFIPSLIDFFRARGLDHNCYFHISDEPHLRDLETYSAREKQVAPYLKGYTIMDALSDYEFYTNGASSKPIPAIYKIKPFLENKVKDLWAYYCGANGCATYTNRYLSMPLGRVRILGVLMYMHNIKGFLHWGFNFYNNQYSYDHINPFLDTTGNFFGPSGDTFIVYPGPKGTPLESLRLNAMREAMEDIRLLELCESIHGRDYTEKLVLKIAGGKLTFEEYPTSSEFFTRLTKELCSAIKDN